MYVGLCYAGNYYFARGDKKKKYFVVKVTFNMIFTRTNEAGVGVLLNENVD